MMILVLVLSILSLRPASMKRVHCLTHVFLPSWLRYLRCFSSNMDFVHQYFASLSHTFGYREVFFSNILVSIDGMLTLAIESN